MGQVVMFFDEKHESALRRLAKEMYRGKKGAMVKVASEGIDLLDRQRNRLRAYRRILHEAENAKNLGIGTFRREEAYE